MFCYVTMVILYQIIRSIRRTMFTNIDNDVVGFNSNFVIEKNITESGIQTTEFSTCDTSTSPINRQCAHIQTDRHESIRPSTPAGLKEWLDDVVPMVLKELEMNESSVVFQTYNPYALDKSEDIKAKLIQTLDTKCINKDNINELSNNSSNDKAKIPISELSWSSAGSTLAVACGFLYHTDWCQHDGYLHIYSIRGREEELKHIQSIKMSSCVTSAIFHPSVPALLATASFSGEISIWNLQHLQDGTNRDVLSSSNSDLHSGRAVSSVLWMSSEQIIKYFPNIITNSSIKVLISAGSDSKIIVWIVDTSTSTLTTHTCFEVRSATSDRIEYSPDISCMDFCHVWDSTDESDGSLHTYERKHANEYFVIGCRTGEILLCKTLVAKFSQNPCIGNLQSHNACVLSLKFCATRPRILLTLGGDLEIRIYDILKNSPIQIVSIDCDLSSVDWLPNSDSHVLGTVSDPSHNKNVSMLQVINIVTKNKISIDGLVEQNASGLSALTINHKFVNRLACGDMSGFIKIWNIPFNEIAQ